MMGHLCGYGAGTRGPGPEPGARDPGLRPRLIRGRGYPILSPAGVHPRV